MALEIGRPKAWRIHKNGMQIYMYKDNPGVFLDVHGNEVSSRLAKEVGFDVDHLLQERAIIERKAAVFAEIEAEMREGMNEKTLAKEAGGFKMMQVGKFKKFIIEDAKGNAITPVALPQDQAEALLARLADEEELETLERESAPKAKEKSKDKDKADK